MNIKDVDRSKLSPMMLQYLEIKDNYKDVIVFFRLGDFYEMFFEDAILVSKELELILTGKSAGLSERIPMCGIPHHASNVYLNKLIELGYKVAICEQVEDPSTAKGVVKREVLQVVSKGTVMSEDLLNEKSNNYIASVIDFNYGYVITYTDMSTGEFKSLIIEDLISELLSLNVNEIVVKPEFDKNLIDILKSKYKISISYFNNIYELIEYKNLYSEITDIRYLEGINLILCYLNETQKRTLSHLQKIEIVSSNSYLKMDINTKRNLELTENLRLKSRTYSLLWLLDKTKTAMGSRLLKSYIETPLVDKEKINKRYDIVSNLLEEFILKEELKALLYEIYDLERLCGRIAYNNCNARDLLQLKNSIKVFPKLKNILKDLNYKDDLLELKNLYELLENAINDNPPILLKEGNLIKDNYDSYLDELRSIKKNNKDFILKIESDEKARSNIKNLKVGFNKIFGYYIEITKGNVKDVPSDYERKQTLANCERYITPLLKEKEELILNAEEKIINLEYEIFNKIKDECKNYIKDLQYNAKIIAEIDVLQSFAVVSEENNYVRPNLVDEKIINIKNSRHPVVEKVLKEEFVKNDIVMDLNTNILLITGPNMSGKSTYMRELVITVIMAQIGCFIPCDSAEFFVFDKIFTRIGASDDLVGGESTFMVEMVEANNAIKNATDKSLIIFDELGRGTATYDGMALAQAIIEHIHNNIKCKTLFSTHYHELTDLEKKLKHLKNIHVSALEENNKIIFLHKIKDGSIDKSYGIHVAKLAKLPDSLINRANEILKIYEKKEKPKVVIQQELEFKKEKSNIEQKLEDLDLLNTNPIDAMNFLYNLKKDIENK